jgi:putative ABC transport system permease protein
MEIVKGRNFSKDFGADSNGIIINESTAKLIGYDDPIGQKLYTIRDNSDNSFITYDIIGVVRNFHFESLRQNISPVSFILGRSRGFASFKINTSNIHEIVKQAENKWKTLAPGMPFSHQFLDESFDEMYRNEQRVGKIALIFAVLAVFIACLGLFGLSTFIAEQRTKEIGIRKVLGASVQGIVRLLSKNFLILVLVSFIIAAPLAWYFMNSWLQDFAFRVDIGWWVFALAALIAVVIALTTVSFQAIRAALSNPVKSLRSE